MSLLKLFIICKGFRTGTVVLHNDKFQILVGGTLHQRTDTGIQILAVVLIGNDHRHKGLSLNPKMRVVNAVIHTFFHGFCRDSHTLIVRHNRSGAGLKGVHLAFRIAGCGTLMAAPVVEHLWNMNDFSCFFRTPENKIIILSTVKLLPKASHLIQKTLFYYKQMADIIDTGEKIRVKIRLKMRVKQRLSVHIQLILIRIKDFTVRMLVDCLYYLIKGVLRKGIVVICQDHKIAGSHFKSHIGIAGNAPVSAQHRIAYSGILLGVAL